MNELVLHDPKTAVVIPARLRDEVQHWRDIPDDLRKTWRPIYFPEASAVARELIAEQQTMANDATIAAWLMRLNDGVAANLEPEQLARRISFIITVLGGDLPAYCWTDETLRVVAKVSRWFPTAADLNELLEPIKIRRQQTIDLLLLMSQRRAPEGGWKSEIPYPVIPAPPETPAPHFDPRTVWRTEAGVPSLIQKPERSVEAQLAALGFAPDGKTRL